MERIPGSGPSAGLAAPAACLALVGGVRVPRPCPPPGPSSLTGFSLPCVRLELEGASLG